MTFLSVSECVCAFIFVCILLPGDRLEIVPCVKHIKADSSITKFSRPLVSSNLTPFLCFPQC